MGNKKLNAESILQQLIVVEQSIRRAKLPFETSMLQEEVLEVTLYELIKSMEQIKILVREIGYPRFEPVTIQKLHYPIMTVDVLNLCPYCGNPNCTSDHK